MGSFFLLLNSALVPALQAQLMMHWGVLANIAGRTGTLILTIVVISAGGGLQAIVAAYALGNAVTLVLTAVAVHRLVRIRPMFNLRLSIDLLRSAVVIGLILAVDALFFYVNTLLLGVFRTAAEVGLYAAAYKFVEFVLAAGNAIHVSVFPSVNRYVQAGDERLRPLLDATSQGLLTVCIPIIVITLLIPGSLVTALSGTEFEGASSVLTLFSLLFPILYLGYLYSYCLLATNRERLLLILNVAALAGNIAVFCVVVPAYGLTAAAWVSVGSAASLTAAVAYVFRLEFGYLPRVSGLGGTPCRRRRHGPHRSPHCQGLRSWWGLWDFSSTFSPSPFFLGALVTSCGMLRGTFTRDSDAVPLGRHNMSDRSRACFIRLAPWMTWSRYTTGPFSNFRRATISMSRASCAA